MTTRQFRFGVNLLTSGSRAQWQAKARQAEDLGYDVILVPDHLGMPAPFPALVSAAEATSRPRLGTFVLNSGFYRPALLARDVAGTHELIDGRLELGLGAGYVQEEFEAAGLPFPGPGARVDHLARTVTELRGLLAANTPPIMVAGQGNRLLRLAAEQADIVGLAGVSSADGSGLADKIEIIRRAAGPRLADIELNLLFMAVFPDTNPAADLSMLRRFAPDSTDEEILQLPTVLRGSTQAMADTLVRYRETHGLSYFTVTEPSLTDFAEVIKRLR